MLCPHSRSAALRAGRWVQLPPLSQASGCIPSTQLASTPERSRPSPAPFRVAAHSFGLVSGSYLPSLWCVSVNPSGGLSILSLKGI